MEYLNVTTNSRVETKMRSLESGKGTCSKKQIKSEVEEKIKNFEDNKIVLRE